MIRDKIVPYLNKCKRLFAGTETALQYIRSRIGKFAETTNNLNELKVKLMECIDDFIMERIIYA